MVKCDYCPSRKPRRARFEATTGGKCLNACSRHLVKAVLEVWEDEQRVYGGREKPSVTVLDENGVPDGR